MGWTVRGSNPGGCEIFRARPDRPWGPPSLLYNGYLVSFPGVKQPGCDVNHPPPSSTEVKGRVELYLYSPSGPSWPVLGWTLSFYMDVKVIYWTPLCSVCDSYFGASICMLINHLGWSRTLKLITFISTWLHNYSILNHFVIINLIQCKLCKWTKKQKNWLVFKQEVFELSVREVKNVRK
jgi:hypothetical protein